MFKRKIILCTFIILALLISISVVSADDNLTSTDDTQILEDGDFDELQNRINHANETVSIQKSYSSNDKDLTINKSLTLRGIGDEAEIGSWSGHGININSGHVTMENLKLNTLINANNSTLTIINCTFIGKINNIEGNVSIINTTFTNGLDSNVKNLIIENSTFNGGYSVTYGDTINFNKCRFNETTLYNYNKKTVMENSQIIAESQFKQIVFYNTSLFEINNCEITNFSIHNSGNLTLNMNRTKLNKAQISNYGAGYGVFNVNIFNSIIYKSTIKNEENITITNCNFTNTTGFSGMDKNISIDNSNFDMFIIQLGEDGITRISNSSFTNKFLIETNHLHAKLYLDNCRIMNIKSDNSLIKSFGGMEVTDYEITNCIFTNNTCEEIISIFKGVPQNSTINDKITNNVFINNTCSRLITWQVSPGMDYENINPKCNFNLELNYNIFISNYDKNNDISKIFLYSENYFPEFTYVDEYGETINPYNYANIYCKKNFYGINIENANGIKLLDIIKSADDSKNLYTDVYSINIDLVNNTLRFVDKNNDTVSMPDCKFTIINKTTKEVIIDNVIVKNGEGKFTYDKNLTFNDVYILNEASEIVNKPKLQIIINRTGSTFEDTYINVKIKDGNATISDGKVLIISRIFDDYNTPRKIVIKNNTANGVEAMSVYLYSGHIISADVEIYFMTKDFGLSYAKLSDIQFKKTPAIAKVSDITATYNTAKTVEIALYDQNTNSPIKDRYNGDYDRCLEIYVYKNGKVVEMTEKLVKKVIKYNLPKLNAGTYKLVLTLYNSHTYKFYKTVKLTVNKKKLTVKAPKVTNKFKKNKYFQVTAKNMKNLKIKVKVYTGKKSKTYTIKTNAKGVAKLNTKSLKVGKHKVEITSGDNNYKITAKSTITIKR